MTPFRFNCGDVVKILKHTDEFGRPLWGTIVRAVEGFPGSLEYVAYYDVLLENDETKFYVQERWLRLLSPVEQLALSVVTSGKHG